MGEAGTKRIRYDLWDLGLLFVSKRRPGVFGCLEAERDYYIVE